MPSYTELQAEPWWSREVVTAELSWLGSELRRLTGRPREAWGDKGNNRHLSGGHRSQEWILNSDYCTNRSYTVQTGLSSDQLRHIGACDWTPGDWGTTANRELMVRQTKNLWDAAKAGKLTGLRQIFGTLDGRNATGLNVVSGSTTVPDSSHLDHWHLTFDRRYLRDAGLMSRILSTVLTGKAKTMHVLVKSIKDPLGKVFLADGLVRRWLESEQDVLDAVYLAETGQTAPLYRHGEIQEVANLDAYGREIDAGAPVALSETDRAAIVADLVAGVTPLLPTPQEIAVAVADEDHRRSAD
jgi:hypothetical protein